ncbi:glycosyltransferase [Palleronia sp. LCG004]|uniref:glycosyltransferase n=1 Tax=Palleronia sp. LCG004 TaxID=3079304 RepID=UPI0029438D31|nr:glycosyltransferase [Palleronia sp. LCG004]WOI55705.1 glycosyltransferase [Palleronia sp. LCG004]
MTSEKDGRSRADNASLGVVIPSFGRPEHVRRAVRSAVRSGVDEVVVVDDASPVPVDLDEVRGDRVRLVRHEENRGVCAARNTGMGHSESSHLIFLDDDDALLPWAGWFYRRWIRAAAAQDPLSIVVGGIVVEGSARRPHIRRPASSRKREIWGLDAHLSRNGHSINTKQAAAIPRVALETVGGWDEALRSRSSSEMFYRLTEITAVAGHAMPVYRLNRGGHDKLTANPALRAESHGYIARKHADLLADPARRELFEATHRNMLGRTAGPEAKPERHS